MLQECSILKTVGIFFKEPTKDHYLLEISRKANLAHTSVTKQLKILKKINIIKERIEKKGKREFPIYRSNIHSKEYKENKKLYNLILLKNSKLIDFLKDYFMPKSIVVFGSFLKGEDIEDSDIDIFIECKKAEINLKKFEKMLNRKIQLHFKDIFKKYPKELKNNIINGITLSGFLEAF